MIAVIQNKDLQNLIEKCDKAANAKANSTEEEMLY